MPESMRKRLGDMLVDEGIITDAQLEDAMQEQKSKGGRLEKILIDQGYVTQDVIMAFVGTQLGIPQVNLSEIGEIPSDVVFSVPEAIAVNHCLIPIVKKENKLMVAMSDPLNVFAIDDIKMTTGFEVEPAIAGEAEIKALLAKYYGGGAGGAGAGGGRPAGICRKSSTACPRAANPIWSCSRIKTRTWIFPSWRPRGGTRP